MHGFPFGPYATYWHTGNHSTALHLSQSGTQKGAGVIRPPQGATSHTDQAAGRHIDTLHGRVGKGQGSA